MADVSDNLVLELLRAIRADTEATRRTVTEHGARLAAIELGVARLRREVAGDAEIAAEQGGRLDAMSQRIERIERRQELRDP
ncbi:MAG: hypothetical protein JSR21_14350 [Proteobacteria bacterium]|nr:hypothetical protein [Pseudomonadota bacterium]